MDISKSFVYLNIALCLMWKMILIDSRFCPVSVKSAREVTSCPTEQSEVLEASRKLGCDKLAMVQNCSSPSDFKYHCVMNVFENATVEVCAPTRYISSYCTEFNMDGGRIQPHYPLKCVKCPARYISTDAYKCKIASLSYRHSR